LSLFGDDARMLATGEAYLRIVGPAYGFFGLGLSLYFASQGAGRLGWPLLASVIRLAIGIGCGWLALALGASLNWLFVALAFALVVYGTVVAVAIASGAWYSDARRRSARLAP
jgi:Na+-driven multidrug efflux pump